MLKSHSERIANEILMYFRNIRKNSTDVYLGDSIEIDKDGNPLTIQETISDSKDLAEDLEKKIKWEKVCKIIENMDDEREKEIIILRYGLDNKKPLTQREVAQRLNISRSYVSRIEKKVLSDIKNKFDCSAVKADENFCCCFIRSYRDSYFSESRFFTCCFFINQTENFKIISKISVNSFLLLNFVFSYQSG